jgi:hypothetical protein
VVENTGEYADGVCGNMNNLCVVRSGALISSDLSQSGATGIMRKIMQIACQRGIKVSQTTPPAKELGYAEEIFRRNSLHRSRQATLADPGAVE